jgi:uncharacterized caspase-like protein
MRSTIIAFIIILSTQTLFAQTYSTKIGFIIGNSDYQSYYYDVSPLPQAKKDALNIATSLQNIGFKTTLLINPTTSEILVEADNLYHKINNSDSAFIVFYYAGHAIQINGNNYILPVDSFKKSKIDIKKDFINISHILCKLFKKQSHIKVAIIDACRINPFKKQAIKTGGVIRSIRGITLISSDGLAEMTNIPVNTFIAFSTSPNKVAFDGVYTKYLVNYLKKPGYTIEDLFKNVRIKVYKTTNKMQQPWERSSLIERVYFRPPKEVSRPKRRIYGAF